MAMRLTTSVQWVGIFLYCLVSSSSAFSQSETEQALEFLRLSLQCAVPPQTAKDGDSTKRTLTTKSFTGDTRKFSVTGKSITRTFDGLSDSVDTDEEDFSYTASFSDFSVVVLNNKSVSIDCSNRLCIQKNEKHEIFPVPNCTSADCDDAFEEKKHQYRELTLYMCDQETAENAKLALDELIRVNLGETAPSVSGTRSQQTSIPPMSGNYSIRPNVSEGIQNMRSGPGVGHSVVVAIPAGSSGVALGTCQRSDDGKTKQDWCQATWNGYTGWIFKSGLLQGKPSFDCGAATKAAEQAICADEVLAGKDTTLMALYTRATGRLTGNDRHSLIAEQRAWLIAWDECTGSKINACVENLYDNRIRELQKR